MKKLTSIIMILVITATFFSGCTADKDDTNVVIRVAALKGATAIGMVKLMQDSEKLLTNNNYDFSIMTTDEMIPLLTKGEIDIAAVPANLAAVLYQNLNKQIKVIAINTLGVLYVVEKNENISSVEDLRGKTIYATGKGAVPEFALNYVLTQNGIDPTKDLTIEYKSEAAEIIPLLKQSDSAIAYFQQPFVTNALMNVENLNIALNWTEEWNKVSNGESSMLTGVMVVRTEFLEKHPDLVKSFLSEYKLSTFFANEHVEETADLVGKYGIVTAEIAKEAIPFCNIAFISGNDMKNNLNGYLKVLFDTNPQSVGGTMPDEDFYFVN